MTDWYVVTGIPGTKATGASSPVRGEFNLIATQMQKLPMYTGNAGKFVAVNSTGTALEAITNATALISIGLGIGTDVQAWDAQLDDIAALTPTDSNIMVGDGSNWVVESGATARTSLGLTIGTDVQAWDAGLLSIAGLTTAANKMIYTNGSDSYVVIDLTAAGRDLLDDADAAAQRVTLGLLGVSTDNSVPRHNGTGGITQDSGVIISDDDEASGVNILQVMKGGDYTFAAGDQGKSFVFTGIDLTATIPANSSWAAKGGTRIEVTNLGSTDLTLAITTDIMLGGGASDNRALAQNESATLTKQPAGTELEYSSGGTTEIVVGDIITGLSSAATGVVTSVVLDSGTWAGGDAVGQIVCAGIVGGPFQAEGIEVNGSGDLATIASGGGTATIFWHLVGGLS